MGVSITLTNVSVELGANRILKDLSFSVDPGEFVALVGPSGCGKTTTLRVLAGLTTPNSGDIAFNGRSVLHLRPDQRSVGMCFQNNALYPRSRVIDNLVAPLKAAGHDRAERMTIAREIANEFDIEPLLLRSVETLSGGERQRVALARALVRRPSVLLLDEPLSSLDGSLRRRVQNLLIDLHLREKCTIVYVTHDVREAVVLANRMIVLERGEIVQQGSIEELASNPETFFVVEHIDDRMLNILTGVVEQSQNAPVLILNGIDRMGLASYSEELPSKVVVVVPPDAVALDEGGSGQVEKTINNRMNKFIRVCLRDTNWWALSDSAPTSTSGISVRLKLADLLFFAPDGRRLGIKAADDEMVLSG